MLTSTTSGFPTTPQRPNAPNHSRLRGKKGEAVKASDIAQELELTKAEINSKLYQMEGVVLTKTVGTPHFWNLFPLEDQVLNTLKSWGDDGVSGKDIAKGLGVARGDVNPILYKYNGTKTRHNDEDVPKWCYID